MCAGVCSKKGTNSMFDIVQNVSQLNASGTRRWCIRYPEEGLKNPVLNRAPIHRFASGSVSVSFDEFSLAPTGLWSFTMLTLMGTKCHPRTTFEEAQAEVVSQGHVEHILNWKMGNQKASIPPPCRTRSLGIWTMEEGFEGEGMSSRLWSVVMLLQWL